MQLTAAAAAALLFLVLGASTGVGRASQVVLASREFPSFSLGAAASNAAAAAASSPLNRFLPQTLKGLGSDLESAQQGLGGGLESAAELAKSLQEAASSRYQAMDQMYLRFLAELAQPENLCRQLLAESRQLGSSASSLLGQAASGASQASQGAASYLSKFAGLAG